MSNRNVKCSKLLTYSQPRLWVCFKYTRLKNTCLEPQRIQLKHNYDCDFVKALKVAFIQITMEHCDSN